MEKSEPRFSKYLFVCGNRREMGVCCGAAGEALRERLKRRVAEMGLAAKIRVSRSGCLDVCALGPNVLLMPDNVWFKHVRLEDAEEIVRAAAT